MDKVKKIVEVIKALMEKNLPDTSKLIFPGETSGE
jgi:hypothetical protein